jgi:VIT1/CCC1 family predicted Fe2+/Mn2+ transporter
VTTELAPPHKPEMHHRHRDVTGGWLRPATFGVLDGLVSNFALVAGIAGSGAPGHSIIVTGLAGLVAGACSMASGEFVSVTSQTELMRAEVAVEQRELARDPEGELRELTAIFMAKGLRHELASEVARELTADPEVTWRTHVREELGVDPDDLPSPWLAAGSSFTAFAAGAFIPLAPFLFGATGIGVAVVLSVFGLVTAGAIVSRLTARPWWVGSGRQLAFGAMSAAVTFAVGLLVGSAVS